MIKRKSKRRAIPSLSDLRHPVAVYESKSVPDDFDGFDTSVKPVASLWAAVDEAAATYSKSGSNTDTKVDATEFIVRGEGLSLNKGQVLFHRKSLFTVVYAEYMTQTEEWVVIYGVDSGLLSDGDFSVLSKEGEDTGKDSSSVSQSQLWSDGL